MKVPNSKYANDLPSRPMPKRAKPVSAPFMDPCKGMTGIKGARKS